MTRMSEVAYKAMLRSNADLHAVDATQGQRGAIPMRMESDALRAQFDALWAILRGPVLEQEYRFHPIRKWRFDYACPAARIAIELNGGVWSGGRHVRGAGYLRDREKINAAQLMGWRVIELGTGAVTDANLEPIIEAIAKAEMNA